MHSKVEARDGERCAMEHGPYYGGQDAGQDSEPNGHRVSNDDGGHKMECKLGEGVGTVS